MSARKTQPGSTVWHRANDTGYEVRRSATKLPPEGTGWNQGFPPKSPEEQQRVFEERSRIFKGRVITEEWRARMSQASKGRPKSPEHRAAMSLAHKARNRNKGAE